MNHISTYENGRVYGWLCRPAKRFLDPEIEGDCDQCLMLKAVLDANLHPWWRYRRPFTGGVTNSHSTPCARFYALKILRSIEETETFARWEAAHTFERLREMNDRLQGQELGAYLLSSGDQGTWADQYLQQIGCWNCGTSPSPNLLAARTRSPTWGQCRVCDSHDISWPQRSHRFGCEAPSFTFCECP